MTLHVQQGRGARIRKLKQSFRYQTFFKESERTYNTIQLLILPIGFFRTNLNVQEKKKKYKNVLKTYDVIVSTIL